MTIILFCNYLNHHQVYVADEMYRLLGDNFYFVATLPRDSRQLKGGEDYSSRFYCIMAAESDEAHSRALELAENANVCVFGACSQEYALRRAVRNPGGLAFEMGERWLKRGTLNILSPVLRSWWLNYRRYYRKANFYKLCSGAFVAADDMRLGCYKGRHFKWGYLPALPNLEQLPKEHKAIQILWCARLISWKHPKLPLQLAKRLKNEGYSFHINIVGDGEMRSQLDGLISKYGIADCVTMHGNISNEEVLKVMNESAIFLFTSDRMEGWGAVLNEAMSVGCCVVANKAIGSVPYLIKEQETGLTYDGSIGSLYSKVKYLLDYPEDCKRIGENAYHYIQQVWSPTNAARSLLTLVEDLSAGSDTSITEGPCSKA